MTCENRLRHPAGGAEFAERAGAEAVHAVETLEAVGMLSQSRAESWRRRLAEAQSERAAPASPDQRREAEAVMRELLEQCGADPEADESALHRFEGASLMLSSTGLIDARAWDQRLRRQAGWPSAEEEEAERAELNRSVSQAELLSVIAGPQEPRRGFRVLFGLRFEDGLSFVLDCAEEALAVDWPAWILRDSQGREYLSQGGGSADNEQHCTFRGAPSPGTAWIELELEDHADVVFRMAL
jgi:hypothetical protein